MLVSAMSVLSIKPVVDLPGKPFSRNIILKTTLSQKESLVTLIAVFVYTRAVWELSFPHVWLEMLKAFKKDQSTSFLLICF